MFSATRILRASSGSLFITLGENTLGAEEKSEWQYDPVTDTGYYGLVSSTDLIDGAALATQIGLTAGTAQYSDSGWFKFYVGPEASCNRNNNGYAYVAYVAKMPNRFNLSWNSINAVNAVYGYRHEPLEGINSQVRLITGASSDPTVYTNGLLCSDNAGGSSEYNDLFYRIHEATPSCSDTSIGLELGIANTNHAGPQIAGANWSTFNNTQTGVLHTINNGSLAWSQETIGPSPVNSLTHGYRGLAQWGVVGKAYARSYVGWRPVLQPTSPTVLLLHGSGTDGSTNITDSSVYGHPVTVHGNAQISTAQSVYPGGSSMYFDGSGSYLSIPTNDHWNFRNGEYTIDCWLYKTGQTHPNGDGIVGVWGSTSTRGWILTSTSFTNLRYHESNGSTPVLTDHTVPSMQQRWTHIGISRSDTGPVNIFVDGLKVGSLSSRIVMTGVNAPLDIGLNRETGGRYFNGYIQDLRITRNRALYTTNFTPPTAPLPDPDPYDYSLS